MTLALIFFLIFTGAVMSVLLGMLVWMFFEEFDIHLHPVRAIVTFWMRVRDLQLNQIPGAIKRRLKRNRNLKVQIEARVAMENYRNGKRQRQAEAEARWMDDFKAAFLKAQPELEPVFVERPRKAVANKMAPNHRKSHPTSRIYGDGGMLMAEYCDTCRCPIDAPTGPDREPPADMIKHVWKDF